MIMMIMIIKSNHHEKNLKRQEVLADQGKYSYSNPNIWKLEVDVDDDDEDDDDDDDSDFHFHIDRINIS